MHAVFTINRPQNVPEKSRAIFNKARYYEELDEYADGSRKRKETRHGALDYPTILMTDKKNDL